MYAIMGITGNVGGVAARALLNGGHAVRALVRDLSKAAEWAAEGVELVQGDFTDSVAIARVMRGADAAFLMLPPFMAPSPGFSEAQAIIASYREALRQSSPQRLVVLSSIGSEQPSGLGMITATHLLEQALANVTIPIAFVRAGSFFENYVPGYKGAVATGVFHSFWTPTDRAFPMIASVDIGREVARRMVDSWSGKKIVELGSPVSPDALALAMSEVAGRPIEARAIPREQWTGTLEAIGFSPRGIGPYTEMVDSCNSGWIGFGVPGSEAIAGATTPAQFFARV